MNGFCKFILAFVSVFTLFICDTYAAGNGYTLQIRRLNSAGEALSGTVYKLSRKGVEGESFSKPVDAGGMVYFDGLVYGATYTLSETRPPEGYCWTPDVSFTVGNGAPVSGTYVDISNILGFYGVFSDNENKVYSPDSMRRLVRLRFKLIDSTRGTYTSALKNSVFELKEIDAGSEGVRKIPNANGFFEFSELIYGHKYKLEQVGSAEGYSDFKPIEITAEAAYGIIEYDYLYLAEFLRQENANVLSFEPLRGTLRLNCSVINGAGNVGYIYGFNIVGTDLQDELDTIYVSANGSSEKGLKPGRYYLEGADGLSSSFDGFDGTDGMKRIEFEINADEVTELSASYSVAIANEEPENDGVISLDAETPLGLPELETGSEGKAFPLFEFGASTLITAALFVRELIRRKTAKKKLDEKEKDPKEKKYYEYWE